MPGKRSKHKTAQRFQCVYCGCRLWRLGTPKHFLYYIGASEIQQNVHMPHKSAAFLANKGAYVDSNSWIEEFFCNEHGKLWLKVTKKTCGSIVTTQATGKDWQQTTRTIRPDAPNPSVSEYTYRMSRQANIKVVYSRE